MILRVIIASAALHTAAFVAMAGGGGHAPAPRAENVPVELIDIEDEKPAPAHVPEPQPEEVAPAPVQHAGHIHPYPVPADHDAKPHTSSEEHLSAPAGNVAPVSDATAAEPRVEAPPPPRFTMSNHGTAHAHTHGDASYGHGTATASAPAREEPVGEDRVSVPAKLLASAPAAYPPDARASQMEADVGLEIVVDATGHVAEARVAKAVGSGFDESALRAIRAYRFSIALRDGRPVAVRMRWNVQFRLQ